MNRRESLGLAAGAVSTALVTGLSAPASANLPAATRSRGYATGPFGLVHYQDTGGNGLPLVLCHQAPQTSRQFDAVLPELARRGIRAIAIDLPGSGMSDATTFVPKVEDYAKVIPPVLDHLHLRSSHLLGHHTGAKVATEASLQFPDRVLRLILNGVSAADAAERLVRLEEDRVRDQNFVYEPDGSHLMKAFAVRWSMYGPGGDPKLTTRVIVEKFMGYAPFWYGHHASDSYDFYAALQRVKHKALFLSNTGDIVHDKIPSMRKLRPDFAYAELQGGTIDIVDQQPVAWAEAVVRFLRS